MRWGSGWGLFEVLGSVVFGGSGWTLSVPGTGSAGRRVLPLLTGPRKSGLGPLTLYSQAAWNDSNSKSLKLSLGAEIVIPAVPFELMVAASVDRSPSHLSNGVKMSHVQNEHPEEDTVHLLKRWNAGDQSAMHRLIERHLPRLRSHVQQRLGDKLRRKVDSGDVVQEAMLQFLCYSPRFQVENGKQFQGLMRRIVENVLRDQHDWYARKRRAMDRECPLPASSVLHLGTTRSVMRPSEAAEQNEKKALVRLSLELLRDIDREIIILREYDGLPFPEISERLGIKETAVRMRLSRALSRLGQKMGELLGEDLS